MKNFYDLEQQVLRPIKDEHFREDPDGSLNTVFSLILAKHKFLRDAINEMLTYIGPIPMFYKDQILYELD